MADEILMRVIAHIRSPYPDKFGIPRQSGIVEAAQAQIVFLPEYRDTEALRGIEGFSHLWLLWQFSANRKTGFQPTVRPPRLGGNRRMGVFATRSPYRPSPIGLSAVRLLGLEHSSENGTVLRISGADLMDGTPILDIKPYLPYADCIPEAVGGFASEKPDAALRVLMPESASGTLPEGIRAALTDVLAQDPRPRYQHDPDRIYSLRFAGYEVRFTVEDDLLTVRSIELENLL